MLSASLHYLFDWYMCQSLIFASLYVEIKKNSTIELWCLRNAWFGTEKPVSFLVFFVLSLLRCRRHELLIKASSAKYIRNPFGMPEITKWMGMEIIYQQCPKRIPAKNFDELIYLFWSSEHVLKISPSSQNILYIAHILCEYETLDHRRQILYEHPEIEGRKAKPKTVYS